MRALPQGFTCWDKVEIDIRGSFSTNLGVVFFCTGIEGVLVWVLSSGFARRPPWIFRVCTFCVHAFTANCTVRQLMDFVSSKFDVNVDLISVGNFCLYNSYIPGHKKQRLGMTIQAVSQKKSVARVLLGIGVTI